DPQTLASQMLQTGTDDETLQREIAMTPALKVQIEQGRQTAKDALDEQVKNAQIAASQATENAAKFGKSVPFPPEVEAQKIRMEKPPSPSNEDKELADFLELRKTNPTAAKYSADRLGLAKYKAEQIRAPAAVQIHMAENPQPTTDE